jgi:hypothetical protein
MNDDNWYQIVANIERVLDEHGFDDEDGNGWVPIEPLLDVLYAEKRGVAG